MSDSHQVQGAPEDPFAAAPSHRSPESFSSHSHPSPPSPESCSSPSPSPSPEGREEELPIDLEIDALLEFEPVPRKVRRPDGWTPERQREFIHRLALCGSPRLAADQMGKNISGIEAVYKDKGAESFRFAWDSALELGRRRAAERERGVGYAGRAPGLNVRGGAARGGFDDWAFEEQPPSPAQVEEAADSIRGKLLRCRRLYLMEISGSSGRRAAFEVLTELPIDWDKAARGEEQPDEPYHRANQRQADMVLTAESGWSFGELGYGPDRKAEARRMLDEYRAEQGLERVDWSADDPDGEG